MTLSCCLWALSGPETEVVTRIAEAGFEQVDIRPFAFEETASREWLANSGMQVCCVAATHGMSDGASLDSADGEAAVAAISHTERALAYAAELGAGTVYAVPGADASGAAMVRYGRVLAEMAERAQALGMKLCVEHFPGLALPTVAATLEFLSEVDHPNLYLLFDLGHAQMGEGEDPAAAIESAGPRLGYVHLDDNDGSGDLHLSLLDGVLTETTLRQTFRALDDVGYTGAVSLELSPELPDPLGALRRSRECVLRLTEPGVEL